VAKLCQPWWLPHLLAVGVVLPIVVGIGLLVHSVYTDDPTAATSVGGERMAKKTVEENVHRRSHRCDECGSDYFTASSQMSHLCPECSHWMYGYPACPHAFVDGRCSLCGWDGSVSPYLRKLQAQPGRPETE
jgi:hypothetical protein